MTKTGSDYILIADLMSNGEAELQTGPFGTQLKASEYVLSGTPLINVRNIGWGSIRADKLEYVNEATCNRLSSHILRPGDIVFGRKGAVERHVFIRETENGWMQGSDCLRLRINSSRIIPQFASFFLLTEKHQQWMKNHCSHGATMASLNQDIISRIAIPCPSIAEQEWTVKVLGSLDESIKVNTRRIAILEEMSRLIYREWFVNFRFPGHENVKFVDSELGKIPEGWKVMSAENAIDVDPTTQVPRVGVKPFVPMGCLSESSFLISDVEEREGNSGSKFKNGDTLFARITPCLENGKTGLVKFLPSEIAVGFGSTEFIVLRSKKLTEYYIYALARSDEFRGHAIKSMSGATGRQRVRSECFGSYYLAIPPHDLLIRFEELVKSNFVLALKLHEMNANLRQTRDLLLPRLISGELDVSGTEVPEFDEKHASNGGAIPAIEKPIPVREPAEVKQATTQISEKQESKSSEERTTPIEEVDTNDVMSAFRAAARSTGPTPREELLRETSRELGYKRMGPRIEEALRGHLRAAIRRGIIATDSNEVYLATPSFSDYDTDKLVEEIKWAMHRHGKCTREEVISNVVGNLGFKRVTDSVREKMKSAFNAAIRRGILGREGSDTIWREE